MILYFSAKVTNMGYYRKTYIFYYELQLIQFTSQITSFSILMVFY